ncbi:MAG: amidohydrolase family protein, partial [Thermomicrobiales bacterium]
MAATVARQTGDESNATLFRNVRIFDGVQPELSPVSNVLVSGPLIEMISEAPIDAPPDARIIEGNGQTLM